MESSLAWDDTPLFWEALMQRGPRTPWSPERTIVHPPGSNPEMLAAASNRVGATLLLRYHRHRSQLHTIREST